MNMHQKELWQKMIDIIENYLLDRTDDFCSTVGNLEGALDASEIKDQVVINDWYDHWTPLEIFRATDGNKVSKTAAKKNLETCFVFF